MRADLIQKIRGHRDLENVIVLTHNIDGVFLEHILLPVLQRVGSPALTVFAEGSCAFDMYERQRCYLSALGRRYRLVPIGLPHPFRFHPKAVLLSAREQATLFVGSGNAGFGGWRENGEVWAEFGLNEETQDEAPAFAYFRDYLTGILDHVHIAEAIRHDVEDAFGSERKRWVSYLGQPGMLVGKAGMGDSLIDQLTAVTANGGVDRLWVCAPYFDEKGKALEEMKERFSAGEVVALLQEGKTNLSEEVVSNLPEGIALRTVKYVGPDGNLRFLHAKFYGIERGNRVTAVLGSANCSRAAWTISGAGGNAELVAVQELSRSEFRKHFLAELKISNQRPRLEHPEPEETPSDGPAYVLKVLAARSNDEEIRVGFTKQGDVQIEECLVNGRAVKFQLSGDEELIVTPPSEFSAAQRNLSLQLKGVCSGEKVNSNLIWIDHEFELSATSKERALVNTIHQSVREGTWGLPAFNDILRLLQDHLDYQTPRDGSFPGGWRAGEGEESTTVRFTRADVFSDDFGLLSDPSPVSGYYPQGRIDGLRGLLLRYFGFGRISERPSSEGEMPEPEDVDEDTDEDKIEAPRLVSSYVGPSIKTEEIDERERQKMIGLLESVVAKISDKGYLGKRSPELISKDLAIVAILMASAVKENWLPEAEYLNLTYKVWHLAFFKLIDSESDSQKPYHGYIDKLYQESKDPQGFVKALASVDFAAAMAVWMLGTQEITDSPRNAQLTLIQVSAIARFGWLWRTDSTEELLPKIRKLLAHTRILPNADDQFWQKYLAKWKTLIRRGNAIRIFQETYEAFEPAQLKEVLGRTKIRKGELLWQGSAGLCVAQRDCLRKPKEKVEVLCLQSKSRNPRKTFMADHLIPVDEFLQTEQGQQGKLSPEILKILSDFVCAVSGQLSHLTEKDLFEGGDRY